MKLRAFSEDDATKLVACWNDSLPSDFRIDHRLLGQLTWQHPSWPQSRSLLAFEQHHLVGFCLARMQAEALVVDALVVRPQWRRKGLASNLLKSLEHPRLRFGGGPAHFLPGLPVEFGQAASFFNAQGFAEDYLAEDLHLISSPRSESFLSCESSDHDSVLAMIKEEFSYRWTEDTRARFEAGDTADVIIIKKEGAPVAFCQTWHYQSKLLGPSVFWLRHECEKYGGIGPVGVRQSERGQGLGRDVVLQALSYLHSRAAEQVVVDWTSIGPFYEKCGFKTWQKYRGYIREEVTGV